MNRPFSSFAAACLLAAACAPADSSPQPEAARRLLADPVSLPAVELTDVDGEPVALEAGDGRVKLLFFGYTNCPDICPVHMANLAAALRDLPLEVTRKIDVVFVTTDPERDTPDRIREWLGALHPRFVGVRLARDEVQALEAAVGVPGSVVEPADEREDYFVGHAAQVLAFGPDGVARVAYPWGTRQRDWIHDLPRLVEGEVPAGVPGA